MLFNTLLAIYQQCHSVIHRSKVFPHKHIHLYITYIKTSFIIYLFYCEIHLKYCQDTINRQFNSTMENNFAGKTACSLSYHGAGVR